MKNQLIIASLIVIISFATFSSAVFVNYQESFNGNNCSADGGQIIQWSWSLAETTCSKIPGLAPLYTMAECVDNGNTQWATCTDCGIEQNGTCNCGSCGNFTVIEAGSCQLDDFAYKFNMSANSTCTVGSLPDIKPSQPGHGHFVVQSFSQNDSTCSYANWSQVQINKPGVCQYNSLGVDNVQSLMFWCHHDHPMVDYCADSNCKDCSTKSLPIDCSYQYEMQSYVQFFCTI